MTGYGLTLVTIETILPNISLFTLFTLRLSKRVESKGQ